ncbi:MAG: hypothetical protein EOP09_10520, partial [Proteobacteria bacterium]
MSEQNRQKLRVRDVAMRFAELAARKPDSFEPKPGVLHVVPTPIGHLGDLGLRSGMMLANADLVLCEDTRVTKSLYSLLGISPPRLERFDASREHSEKLNDVLQQLKNGAVVVLVSDAGMPGVSDPGSFLVRACHEQGIEVCGVAGPSALPLAIALSGGQASESRFLGFFPRDKSARQELATRIRSESEAAQWIWHESPERILASAKFFAAEFPDFRLILCKELTKQYERNFSGTARDVA